MPTPTFREPLPDDEDEDARPPAERPPIEQTLVALGKPPVRPEDVAHLSDLGRADAAVLTRAWPHYPEASRVEMVRLMSGLSEDRVDLNFGRALRVALRDDSPVVRQLAVAGLWEDERTDLLGVLTRLVRDDVSQDVRAEAAKALGRFAERAAAGELPDDEADALQRLLLSTAANEAEGYGVRRRALESLGALADEPAVRDEIENFLTSDDEGFRGSALYAMGQSGDSDWLPILLAELNSDDAELRYEAARACGALGDADAIAPLVRAARDDDPEVRHAAIGAIGAIGGRAAIRALEEIASRSDEDADVVEAALEEAAAMADPIGFDA